MVEQEIKDPRFRQAIALIDAGDVNGLGKLLKANPELVRERLDYGEGYFREPYLLWFVAGNPVRGESLPRNIARIAGVIIDAAKREGVDDLQYQLDYALGLVSSGRVARESGVQLELIDLLIAAGARPESALQAALAHREVVAVQRLLERGAKLTLTAAVATKRSAEVTRLGINSSPEERQEAFAAAALYGQAGDLEVLIDLGVELNAYSPPSFHPHATALHHAVDSGSLDAVKLLVREGAQLKTRDRMYDATPLDWAEHLGRREIADYLRDREQGGAA
ncbi:MAG TPA: ankyrin repeat domain-containing protein [Gemmatimonadaceae bacterium]|nr:ankyrin repeat domain-containing protein [Gemmatimonadaceae bacterium]